jgi:hypothetical protein
VRRDEPAGDRRDADHPPAVALDHARQQVMHEQHRRADMDRLRAPPVLGADFPDRAERAGDAGVVDEEVDRTEQLLDLARGALDRRRIGHVAAHAQGVAAGVANDVRELVELRQRAREQRHRGAFGRQALGDRPPEPAPGAGDQATCPSSMPIAQVLLSRGR